MEGNLINQLSSINHLAIFGLEGSMLGLIITGIFTLVVIGAGAVFVIKFFYRKVEQGDALIINQMRKVRVTFTGGIVYPVIHKAEKMDISVKKVDIDRRGKDGLICEDNIRADIKVTFYVRVNKAEEDVLKVAQSVGCARASDIETLEELFQAKFSEALKTVGKQMEFTTLFTERESFKEKIIEVIGEDLNGYKLEDVAIDYLEQTPLSSLDPSNILDAQGIRKITSLTAVESISTNEAVRNKEKVIKKQDVEAKETILELEKQQADAEARQQREIENIRAREEAEIEKIRAEEQLKADRARIAAEEDLMVADQNKERQVEIATKAKERAIKVEAERVMRDQQLEEVERERLVAVKSVEKEKAIEVEKKAIQDVIRERVMVEKTVAIEQEKIKDTVAVAGAERERQVEVIAAEKAAKEMIVREAGAAKAKEESARSLYEEQVLMAEATRVSAEKEAEAKKVMAEGLIAEQSAAGLSKVRVEEAEANAIELQGKAKAAAETEAHKASAFGIESKGEANAKAMSVRFEAEADGTKAKGEAEAAAMAATYSAEAEGIDQKANAMKKLDGIGKEHEEFKLNLGKQERVELAAIDVNRHVAEAQASVLSEAMKTANIDIVGGNGEFLNNFFKSISLAKTIDGFVDKSEVTQQLTNGDLTELGNKLKKLIGKEGMSPEDLKNLSLSALLARLALKGKNKGIREEASELQGTVKGMGSLGEMSMEDIVALWMAKSN